MRSSKPRALVRILKEGAMLCIPNVTAEETAVFARLCLDNRVKGKYMYRKTAAELPQIAERGAQEIEKKAMAYLEGKG